MIEASSKGAASWRTSLVLDLGRYRFQGRLRLEGVQYHSQDPKSGAGLRISRQKFGRRLPGECPWATVSFDFEVQQNRTPIELVCELRAPEGKASFDQTSLRLVRLP